MADYSIEQGLLGKVFRLVLKYPLPSLDNFGKSNVLKKEKQIPWNQIWVRKATVPIKIEPDVYEYVFEEDDNTSLIASTGDIIAIYLPEKKSSSKKERLILVRRDTVQSLELYSSGQDD